MGESIAKCRSWKPGMEVYRADVAFRDKINKDEVSRFI